MEVNYKGVKGLKLRREKDHRLIVETMDWSKSKTSLKSINKIF
jgi:hypothetical protein